MTSLIPVALRKPGRRLLVRERDAGSARHSPWFGVIVASVCCATMTQGALQTGVVSDDGFITLIYARHMRGSGATYWNVEDGNLDGYTSALDAIIKAAALRLTSHGGELVAWFVGLAYTLTFAASAVWIIGRIVGTTRSRSLLACATLASLMLALEPGAMTGAAEQFETPLLALLLSWSAYLTMFADLRSAITRASASGVLALLAMTRPEGAGLSLLFWLYLLWRSSKTHGRAHAALPAGLFIAAMLAYFASRFAHFGSLVPNSYYAKTSARRWNEIADGASYLLRQATHHPVQGLWLAWTLAAPLLILARGWATPESRQRFSFLLLAAWAALALVVVEGGDAYDIPRFLAPANVLSLLSLVVAASALPVRAARALAATFAVALTLWIREIATQSAYLEFALPATPHGWARWLPWPPKSECDRQIAAALRNALPAATIAQTDYQRVKFFFDEATVIDLHGLNDRVTAREPWPGPVRWGKATFAGGLARDAQVWIAGVKVLPELNPSPASSESLARVLSTPALFEQYIGYRKPPTGEEVARASARYVTASLQVCGGYFNVLARKDVSSDLARAGFSLGVSGD